MDINELKPNSYKAKEEEKRREEKRKSPTEIKKVTSGTVRNGNAKAARKFADIFIPGDVGNVKTYILSEVLIPSIKNAISDIVKTGIDILLYGESRQSASKTIASKVSYKTDYSKRYKTAGHSLKGYESTGHSLKGYGYDDITIKSRADAMEVLARMKEIIEEYGTVSVAAMYEMCDQTPEFTDNDYGWTDLSSAKIVPVRNGWVIKFPRAMELD